MVVARGRWVAHIEARNGRMLNIADHPGALGLCSGLVEGHSKLHALRSLATALAGKTLVFDRGRDREEHALPQEISLSAKDPNRTR